MAAALGVINTFNLNSADFREYYERLEQYFVADNIINGPKKTAIFITVIGDETYSLLRSRIAPAKPNTRNAIQLAQTLIEHLKPKPHNSRKDTNLMNVLNGRMSP